MGLMEMMKYNIEALSMGEKLLGSLIVMFLGMVTCIVVLSILILCIKIMSSAFSGKNNSSGNPTASAPAPKASTGAGPNTAAATLDDDSELIAVITAAITAISGSSSFRIKNITEKKSHPTLSNWVSAGRFEAFDSRKSTKK